METTQEWRNANGALHRDADKPAIVCSTADGKRKYSVWYKHGRVHRDGGKFAVVHKMDDGVVFRAWYNNDTLTREVYVSATGECLSDTYYYEEDCITFATNPLLGRMPPVTGTWFERWME